MLTSLHYQKIVVSLDNDIGLLYIFDTLKFIHKVMGAINRKDLVTAVNCNQFWYVAEP